LHQHCELCRRRKPLTFHHLVPRTLHSNRWFKKNFTREQMQQGLNLCSSCHRTVHKFLTEKELGRNYNTREKLLEHEKIGSFVRWVATRRNA